jgi:hypothetical protein
MSESERLHALLILSAMDETVKRLAADYAKLKQAADDFHAEFERRCQQSAHSMSNRSDQ